MWLLGAFLLLTTYAQGSKYIVHERREAKLKYGLDRQRIEPDAVLPIRIGLTQNNAALQRAEEWLMGVSHPDSNRFGKHWSQEEVLAAFKPSDETARRVTEWLVEHGIEHSTLSDNGLWIAFDLPAAEAEDLLQTVYYESRTEMDSFDVSCDEYSIPEHLRDHVDYITPGIKSKDVTMQTERSRQYLESTYRKKRSNAVRKPAPKTPPYAPDDLKQCVDSVSPACIRALYNVPLPDPSLPVSSENRMGIYEVLFLAFQADLNKFFEYYTDIPTGTQPIYKSIDGAVTQPKQLHGWRKLYTQGAGRNLFGIEPTLDYLVSIPLIYPQNVTDLQSDDYYWARQTEFFLGGYLNDMLDAIDGSYCTLDAFNITGNSPGIDPVYPDNRPHGWHHKLQCGVYKPPAVLTITYGLPEVGFLPVPYQKRQCLEFLKLGLQGVSVIAGSGDGGVGCDKDTTDHTIFQPEGPGSCPWITNVGATAIQPQKTIHDPEIATDFSGGGFSLIWSRPDYQQSAVSKYFADHDPGIPYFHNGDYNTSGKYNRDGRGFPDVAAIGKHIAIFLDGDYDTEFGTSAAAPIFAAFINRINEERIRAGKSKVGFVNPTLYKHPGVLNDILAGNNDVSCGEGFSCVPGWDPVTGLGTPRYPEMLEVFMHLP